MGLDICGSGYPLVGEGCLGTKSVPTDNINMFSKTERLDLTLTSLVRQAEGRVKGKVRIKTQNKLKQLAFSLIKAEFNINLCTKKAAVSLLHITAILHIPTMQYRAMLSRFSCVRLCDPMNCSPSGSSVHGILYARILQWIAIPFSRGSS